MQLNEWSLLRSGPESENQVTDRLSWWLNRRMRISKIWSNRYYFQQGIFHAAVCTTPEIQLIDFYDIQFNPNSAWSCSIWAKSSSSWTFAFIVRISQKCLDFVFENAIRKTKIRETSFLANYYSFQGFEDWNGNRNSFSDRDKGKIKAKRWNLGAECEKFDGCRSVWR